jgi:hypothetical protein
MKWKVNRRKDKIGSSQTEDCEPGQDQKGICAQFNIPCRHRLSRTGRKHLMVSFGWGGLSTGQDTEKVPET